MAYMIDAEKCVKCGACAGLCPIGAISVKDGKFQIDPEKCVECGACYGACPAGAISK
ncbi:MAG: 4Fe-4S binding protein [Rickettsiales bacterium]|jgi:ferredoxin|nr:4Fe-4S binding protein [Rickettsiales bacterium]